MRDSFEPIRDTGNQHVRRQVDTLEMRRMAESMSALLRPTVHGPGQLRTSVLGAEVTVPGRPFWAQITASAADAAGTICYSWSELWDDGAGNFTVLGNGRSGSATDLLNQAYEANGNPVVPTGVNVVMWLGYDAIHYEFAYCCGERSWVQVTSLTLSVAVQTITISGATGGYFLISGSATHIAWNASAATVQVTARAATGVLVTVSGPNGGPWVITWPDNACHVTPTLDGSNLTGTGTPTISIVHTTQGGYYPGQYGYTSETPCNPQIILKGSPGDVWVRTSTGNPSLKTGVWYRADFSMLAEDGKPVYIIGDGGPGLLEIIDSVPNDYYPITKLAGDSNGVVTFTNPNPGEAQFAIASAGVSQNGIVTHGTQTIGGVKTFASTGTILEGVTELAPFGITVPLPLLKLDNASGYTGYGTLQMLSAADELDTVVYPPAWIIGDPAAQTALGVDGLGDVYHDLVNLAGAGLGSPHGTAYYKCNGSIGIDGPLSPATTFIGTDFVGGICTGGVTSLTADAGGTGQVSYTTGDILYASGSTALSPLGIGSTGDVLTVAGGVPTWAPPGSGLTNPMTTTGDVIYSSNNSGAPARLAIGSSGELLFASSGLPAWSGAGLTWGILGAGLNVNAAAGAYSATLGASVGPAGSFLDGVNSVAVCDLTYAISANGPIAINGVTGGTPPATLQAMLSAIWSALNGLSAPPW